MYKIFYSLSLYVSLSLSIYIYIHICINEYKYWTAYYQKNRDIIFGKAKEYYENNKDRLSKQARDG